MREDGPIVEALRRAFASRLDAPSPQGSCPRPEEIWDAVHGDLEPARTREIVSHLRACAACSWEWSAAMGPTKEATSRAEPERPGKRLLGMPAAWAWAAAAALIVLAGSVTMLARRPLGTPDEGGLRSGAGAEIKSLVAEGATLPRQRFLLRWEPVDEGGLYSVKLFRRDLTLVGQVRNLEKPEWLVPAETLKDLPSGETLAWRVEAQLLDGRRPASRAFLVRLE